jgi:Ca-activated chloride channel family protein
MQRRSRIGQAIAFIGLWAATPAVTAAEPTGGADKTLAPYFEVGGDSAGETLPLEETRVTFTVSGTIAAFTVTQTYRNRGTRPIHAQYVFPASTRAAVNGLTLRLQDHVVEAKIEEREEAKRTYARARSQGKTASLLEQDRPNVFRMSVSNILPQERVQAVLRYTELLVPTDGTYELVFPAVVGPRYSSKPAAAAEAADHFIQSPYTHGGVAPSYAFAIAGTLSTAVPLDELGSPSHHVKVEWKGPSHAEVTLDPADAPEGNRDFILRYRLTGKQVQSGLLVHEGQDESFFLLMAQPPRRVLPQMIPPREYVFIVDVSGSMRGFPLQVAKEVMRELFSGLRPEDRLNVLLFSGGSRLMSPASVPATAQNVAQALALIDRQDGGGGTELVPALEQALALPAAEGMSRSLVVVTDGYIGGEREAFALVRANLGNANVYCFGIGRSVNRYLVEGLAKAGMGEPFVVNGPEGAPAEAARFAAYVRAPVLTHLRLEAEGVELSDLEPGTLPDVLADRPVIIHGKWKGSGAGRLTLTGTSGAGPYTQTFDLAGVKERANPALPILWARARIAALHDFGDGPSAKDQVTALGLRYSLLTQFTSFIAVYEARRTDLVGTDVAQLLPMPSGVTDAAVGAVQTAAEPELTWTLGLAGALILACLVFRKQGALGGGRA